MIFGRSNDEKKCPSLVRAEQKGRRQRKITEKQNERKRDIERHRNRQTQ